MEIKTKILDKNEIVLFFFSLFFSFQNSRFKIRFKIFFNSPKGSFSQPKFANSLSLSLSLFSLFLLFIFISSFCWFNIKSRTTKINLNSNNPPICRTKDSRIQRLIPRQPTTKPAHLPPIQNERQITKLAQQNFNCISGLYKMRGVDISFGTIVVRKKHIFPILRRKQEPILLSLLPTLANRRSLLLFHLSPRWKELARP